MGKFIDLTGQRFGRLTVLERIESGPKKGPLWKCLCICGEETVVMGDNLRRGHTQSCGCLNNEKSRDRMRARNVLNAAHSGRKTRLYSIWNGMKNRCYCPNTINYHNYGGRGITICPEWLHDFAAFRDWALAHGYRDDLSIDRIDVNGNYCPENCRWATAKEQANNKRPRRTLKTE